MIMRQCFGLPDDFDCDVCPYNIGITNSSGYIAGPCGQQNCWYSCTVCRYNNMDDCHEEEDL